MILPANEVSSVSRSSPWEGFSKQIWCFSKGVVFCCLQEMAFTPCIVAELASWLFSKLDVWCMSQILSRIQSRFYGSLRVPSLCVCEQPPLFLTSLSSYGDGKGGAERGRRQTDGIFWEIPSQISPARFRNSWPPKDQVVTQVLSKLSEFVDCQFWFLGGGRASGSVFLNKLPGEADALWIKLWLSGVETWGTDHWTGLNCCPLKRYV